MREPSDSGRAARTSASRAPCYAPSMRWDWRDPKVGWLIVLGAPLALVAAFVGAGAFVWSVNARPMAFDPVLWAANVRGARTELGPRSLRQRMLADLTAEHLRAGMSRSELEALLGAPDLVRGDAVLVWVLDADSPDDIECLDVSIDPSTDRVAEWHIAARWVP